MSIIPSTTLSRGKITFYFAVHWIISVILFPPIIFANLFSSLANQKLSSSYLSNVRIAKEKIMQDGMNYLFFNIIALFKYKWPKYAMYRVHSNNPAVVLSNCMVEALPKALKYKALPSSNLEGNLKRLN